MFKIGGMPWNALFVVFAIFYLPVCGWGEEKKGNIVLDEVVVTSKQEFTEAERKATTHNVIYDQETIKNSTSQTVSEFLAQQGYTITQPPTQYDVAGVNIRGIGTTAAHNSTNESNARLLFFINGKRSGTANMNQLLMNNVERIEIIRGPEMYKYAATTAAGVVNIVTKRGGPDQFSGSIEVGYGSYDHFKGSTAINGLVKNFDYSIGYSFNSIKTDYEDGHGNTVENSTTDGINNINANIGYTFNKRHRIGIEYYYNNVNNAYRPQYVDELSGEVVAPGVAQRELRNLYLTYEGATDDNRFDWHISYGNTSDDYQVRTNFNPGTEPTSQDVDTNQFKLGINYKGDLFDLSAGGDYVTYITYNGTSPNTYYRYGFPSHRTHTSQYYGGYLVGTLKLLKNRLNISGGLRYDHAYLKDDYTGDEPYFNNRRGTYYQEYKNSGTRPYNRTFNDVSPAVGISYMPLDWLKLRANYTRSVYQPSGRNLFSSDISEGYGASGDPRMKTEKGHSYEAGFDIKLNYVNFSASYFYNVLKDPIVYRVLHHAGALGANPQNAQEQVFQGIEVGTSMNLAPFLGHTSFELRPFVNLTYMTVRKELVMPHSFNGWAGHWMPARGVPDLNMNYGIRFQYFPWKFTANLDFNYFGGCDNMGAATKINPILYEKYGHFTVANLSMTKELWRFTEKQNVTLKVHINNIFDEYYSYSYSPSYYNQGRNYYAGLVYNF